MKDKIKILTNNTNKLWDLAQVIATVYVAYKLYNNPSDYVNIVTLGVLLANAICITVNRWFK